MSKQVPEIAGPQDASRFTTHAHCEKAGLRLSAAAMKRRELGGKKAVCSSVESGIVLKKRRCPCGCFFTAQICHYNVLVRYCIRSRERVCVCVCRRLERKKNDADVEEEVATGDSRFFLVISLLAIHHPI